MSRNLTDEGDRPVLVRMDELEDKIDLAGASLVRDDAVEEIDGARSRLGNRTRSFKCPSTGIPLSDD